MKKAVLFSDLHESFKHFHNLKLLIKDFQPAAIIFAGDFLNMGETLGFARQFTEFFFSLEIPFLWVPGNNDFGHGYHHLNGRLRSLEGRVVEVKIEENSADNIGEIKSNNSDEKYSTFRFSGVGGSPASWAGQYSGENIIDEKLIGGSIFVSHMPPPGVFNYLKIDQASPTKKNLRDSPLAHICGHFHNQYGVTYLGQTKIIKLAPLLYGHYAIMDLENLKIDFKRFQNRSLL